MRIDIRDLRFVAKVAETGSITVAASHLGCVQSNVTNRLRQIEATLGIDLFTRAGGRMVPSSAALVLAQAANRAELIVNEALVHAKASAAGRTLLRIGMMESFAATYLADILKLFTDIDILPTTGPSIEIAEKIRLGTLDFGVISQAVRTPDLEIAELWTDRFVLARGRKSRATDLDRIVVIRGIDALLRAQVMAAMTEISGRTPTVIEVGSLDVIRSVVESGNACTILPERYFTSLPFAGTQLRLTPLPIENPSVRICAVRQRNGETDGAWKTLVDGMRASSSRDACGSAPPPKRKVKG